MAKNRRKTARRKMKKMRGTMHGVLVFLVFVTVVKQAIVERSRKVGISPT
ncbi:MAG: hypothetical protein NTW21_14935 [Verrucomicrobia bacterium]|nr:hypothetical protein [Verrucomicrobiota bacterium]